jgi:AraC-like DNA-binding protein
VHAAASVAAFLADPVGRFVAGRAFVAWMYSPSLVGASHFGPFETIDLDQLRALFPLPLHPALVPPYDVIHDLSGVDVLDRRAFDVLAQFLAEHMPQLVGRVRRLAVVRSAGLAGAAFTGLFHDFGRDRFDGQIFADRAAALAWLDVSAEARAAIDTMMAPFENAAPVLRQLRDAIAGDPAHITLEAAAAAIGHSTRSLQRHLAEHATSFRDELARARVTAAKARLVETDDKVEVIALQLGFSSVAAFTTMFGRIVGEPPHAFRRRRSSG